MMPPRKRPAMTLASVRLKLSALAELRCLLTTSV